MEQPIKFSEIQRLPYDSTCITIGNFDGVHLGHQAIILKMVNQANSQGNPLIVVTFFPNPYDYFNQDIQSFYLSEPDQKEDILLSLGVGSVLTLQFDQDLANRTPREFLSVLKDKLALSTLVIGEDFALGKNRQGTASVLKELGKDLDYRLKVLPEVKNGKEDISSTKIRGLLDKGNVRKAAKLLGRYYAISGLVTHGSDRGAKIGLPTANIKHWLKKKLPATGVYATYVHIFGEVFNGITNVGFRPTFESQSLPNIETYIFDFDKNIYGESMKLEFIEKLRDEKKFSGVETLLAQIENDKAAAKRIFDDEKR